MTALDITFIPQAKHNRDLGGYARTLRVYKSSVDGLVSVYMRGDGFIRGRGIRLSREQVTELRDSLTRYLGPAPRFVVDAAGTVTDTEVEEPFSSFATAVFEGLGAASVCWDSLEGTGVFDSTRAKEIGEAILARHRDELHRFSEWLDAEGVITPESAGDDRAHDDFVNGFLAATS